MVGEGRVGEGGAEKGAERNVIVESNITVWDVLLRKGIWGVICDYKVACPAINTIFSYRSESKLRLMKYLFIKGIHFTITLNSYVSLT